MAVSRTFIRGLQSSGVHSSLLRSSFVNGAAPIASTSRHVLSNNLTPATAGFSTHSSSQQASKKQPEQIKIPIEELEKAQHPDDVGHDMTGRKGVRPHTKRTMAAFSMENKACVVTGAARGLGNLMARTFLESGANQVAFLDLSSDEATNAAKEANEWFEQHGGAEKGELDLIGLECDVSNEESVKRAFDRIEQRWGRVDVVVNSAGIVENFPSEEYETSRYQKLMKINLDGAWFVATEAGRRMMANKTQGSIVLIASMSGSIVNWPQLQAPYNASKAGVKHLASCLGVEWAQKNIRVNSLSPGYMLTNLTRVMIEKSDYGKMLKREWESRTPMGRMGNPEDLKGAAVFLASDASKFVTGTDILVDGGYCAL